MGVYWDKYSIFFYVSFQPQPEHGVYTVFVELGETKIEVSIQQYPKQ